MPNGFGTKESENTGTKTGDNAKAAVSNDSTTMPAAADAYTGYKANILAEAPETRFFIITSLISGEPAELGGAITNLSDSWALAFNEETVYGRIDPIPTYSNTTRTISVSMDLIPVKKGIQGRLEDSLAHQVVINRVAAMCYAGYENTGDFNFAVIKAPPLVSIKYANIICSSDGSPLKAYMKSFSVNTQNEGLYNIAPAVANENIYYNRLSLSFEFGIIHDSEIGHNSNGTVKNANYPFKLYP